MPANNPWQERKDVEVGYGVTKRIYLWKQVRLSSTGPEVTHFCREANKEACMPRVVDLTRPLTGYNMSLSKPKKEPTHPGPLRLADHSS